MYGFSWKPMISIRAMAILLAMSFIAGCGCTSGPKPKQFSLVAKIQVDSQVNMPFTLQAHTNLNSVAANSGQLEAPLPTQIEVPFSTFSSLRMQQGQTITASVEMRGNGFGAPRQLANFTLTFDQVAESAGGQTVTTFNDDAGRPVAVNSQLVIKNLIEAN
jgi:hypothetical protein